MTLLPVATPAQARRHLRGLARGHRALAAGTGLALLAATGAAMLVPLLTGELIDAVLEDRGGRVDVLAVVLAAVAVLSAVLGGWSGALVARLGERMLADLREEVVDRALSVPLAELEAAGPGDLLARVGADVDAISESFRDAVPALLVSGLTVAFTGVGLLYLDWRLVLAAGLALPVHVVSARRYLRASRPLFAAERRAIGVQTQRLHDALAGARAIRARREGATARDRVGGASAAAVERAIAASRRGADYGAQLNAAELVAMGGVLVAGFALVRAEAITVGAASAAAFYILRLFSPVMVLLSLLDTIQDATASLVRLVGVAQLPEPAEPAPPVLPGHALAFHDVRFGYREGREVLHGVTLDVGTGERVALVGSSGAGKTTVARLAAGLWPPASGRVTLGGTPLDATTRRLTVLVTQEVHVFAGPLADDVRLARPGASDEDVRSALAAVGALGWVQALPDGSATVVGDGGHRLTSAQAQQLALARVLVADRPVALLDEATAEAGSADADALDAAVEAATRGRTTLIVVHRLSQAATADRVVLMAGGTVVEAGAHDELVAAGGPYADLWRAWSEGKRPS